MWTIRARGMQMPAETFKHHGPHKGAFGYEISTGFDREYERGTSEVRVTPRHDGKVDLDVSKSVWAVYGEGKTGRTNTRTASVTLNRDQIANLIAVLTEQLASKSN